MQEAGGRLVPPITGCAIRSRSAEEVAALKKSGPIAANSMRSELQEVSALAQTWSREQQPARVLVDLPVGTPNAHCSSRGRARGSLAPGGGRRAARLDASCAPLSPRQTVTLATIHMAYCKDGRTSRTVRSMARKMSGPSINRVFFENQPPWNFGCATQRNLSRRWSIIRPRVAAAWRDARS